MAALTARQAAKMMGLAYTTVLDLAKKGLLPHTKIGGQYIFTDDGLAAHFARCEGKSLEKGVSGRPALALAGHGKGGAKER